MLGTRHGHVPTGSGVEAVGAWLAVPQTQRNNLMDFYWIIKSLFLTLNLQYRFQNNLTNFFVARRIQMNIVVVELFRIATSFKGF